MNLQHWPQVLQEYVRQQGGKTTHRKYVICWPKSCSDHVSCNIIHRGFLKIFIWKEKCCPINDLGCETCGRCDLHLIFHAKNAHWFHQKYNFYRRECNNSGAKWSWQGWEDHCIWTACYGNHGRHWSVFCFVRRVCTSEAALSMHLLMTSESPILSSYTCVM